MEARRSGNYEASIWEDDCLQSLTTPYAAQEYEKQAEKLKREVKTILDGTKEQLDQLELIDHLQRLDISHHFADGIQKILDSMYQRTLEHMEKDLYATALQFRLLRQHGYHVPQEVFCSFMDELEGNFKSCLSGDVKGMLCLYEASFLSLEGETILDLAKDFSTYHLRELIGPDQMADPSLAEQIRRALELPLHWRVQKLEARWFINFCETRSDANLILLELAKLDFNMVQARYQDDIKHVSRWYKETGLAEKLSFARDRLAESFFWAVGATPELDLGYTRKIMTKVAVMVTLIDDIYDLYGTLDELKAFTETVESWDINALDRLPEYMQISFLALFNFANEFAYDILRDQGLNIISNLRNLWAELCRAYFLEAKWYYSGYTPSLNEYLGTAWVSISGPLIFFHVYLITTNPINKKEFHNLEQHPDIIRWPSTIIRLANDLGTSTDEMKRGDVSKSIQCYMHETGCSVEDARDYVKQLIDTTLKRMNKGTLMENPIKGFGVITMNFVRISVCLYQYGDGFGDPHHETKKNLASLIVKPINMS